MDERWLQVAGYEAGCISKAKVGVDVAAPACLEQAATAARRKATAWMCAVERNEQSQMFDHGGPSPR